MITEITFMQAGFFAGGVLLTIFIMLLITNKQRNKLSLLQQEVKSNTEQVQEQKEELKEEQEIKENLIRKLSATESKMFAQQESFHQAKKEFTTQFENLATKIFENNSRKFSEQNKESINNLLDPLQEKISDFRKKVEDVYFQESKDRTALHEQVKNLSELNEQLSKGADNLTKALTGDNQVMGNWGEQTLERILEMSGLEKGREYETQVHAKDNEGNTYRPDVVVHLPEKKDIIIDAKVSLTAYERYCNSKDDEEQEDQLKKHLLSLRQHIASLDSKNYTQLKEIYSLDYILMFIPIEAAYITAIKKDSQIFNDAYNKRIVIVCPSTLLITLRTISNIWRYEKQNQNAKTIATKATALYSKFVNFTESVERIRMNINKASSECDTAINQLSKGRGNLVDKTKEFEKLGVQPKKQIPSYLFTED